MGRSTGPILAAGAITLANQSIFNNKPIEWRIPIAAGAVAIVLSGLEKVLPDLAPVLAWLALLTVTLTRTDPNVPAPAESFLTWWEAK